MKPIKLISNGLQVASVIMLIGSFFKDDKDAAKNLRWGALGTFAVGYGLQFTPMYKTAIAKK